MATFNVTDDVLNSEAAHGYFTRADRRVMIGLRATLEMLGLPVPIYAVRRVPGPSPARAVVAAYNADHGWKHRAALAERKPDATPERIAELRGASTYSPTFPG